MRVLVSVLEAADFTNNVKMLGNASRFAEYKKELASSARCIRRILKRMGFKRSKNAWLIPQAMFPVVIGVNLSRAEVEAALHLTNVIVASSHGKEVHNTLAGRLTEQLSGEVSRG